MVMTDPIADMLTRIRNANQMRHEKVLMPSSKIKEKIAEILLEEGFIVAYEVRNDEKVKQTLEITLKYFNRQRAITGIKRISKPGLRVYVKSNEVPKVLNGLGLAIISTASGLLSDKKARELAQGGEVIAYVW